MVEGGRSCDQCIMGELHRSAACIGFYGDDLDPAEITAGLGGEPTVGVCKGGLWRTALGAEKVAVTGSWRIRALETEPGDLDGQINGLLDCLSGDVATWRLFAGRFRGRVFSGLFLATFNEGLTLRPSTLARLGERGLVLDLDIYSAPTPD